MLLDAAEFGSNPKDESASVVGNRVSMTARQFRERFGGTITKAITLSTNLSDMLKDFEAHHDSWKERHFEELAQRLAARMPAVHRWHRHQIFKELREEIAWLGVDKTYSWWKPWRRLSIRNAELRQKLVTDTVKSIRERRRTPNLERARDIVRKICLTERGHPEYDIRVEVRRFMVGYEGNSNWANEVNGMPDTCPPDGINVADLEVSKTITDIVEVRYTGSYRCRDQNDLLREVVETFQVAQGIDDNATVYFPVKFIDNLLTFNSLVSIKFCEAMKRLRAHAMDKMGYTLEIPIDARTYIRLEAQ
jgi:hypothetical protein